MDSVKWGERVRRIRLPPERMAITGRVTVGEWTVPPGGHVWVPSEHNGPLHRQLVAAGFLLDDEERTPNSVLTNGRNLIRDLLRISGATGLNYYAIGTGSTAANKSQTALITEVFRGAITSFDTDTELLTVNFFLPSGSANGNTLVECAPVGNGATGTAGSGTHFARSVHSARVKTISKAFTYAHDIYLNA